MRIKENIFSIILLCLSSVGFTTNSFAYCNAGGSNTSYEWIDQVHINDDAFQSDYDNGYFLHSQAGELMVGENMLTLTPGYSSYSYLEYWRGWLDVNGDDVFDSSEQIFEYSGNASTSITFDVPEAAAENTRLRVSMKYGSYPSACESFYYGETEDFDVSIATASYSYNLTLDPDFTVNRTGELGDTVVWVVEVDGQIALQRNAANELSYQYYRNFEGSNIRIWLKQFVNGQYEQVSNIVEYTPGVTDLFEISLGDNYEIFRSGYLGDNVQWAIEKDGAVVLQRNAANELSYTYFNNTDGSVFRVWLKSFIDGEYKVVSNTLTYIPGQESFELTIDSQFELTRDGQLGDPVVWVVEEDGQVVLERNAANEMNYTYYGNNPGSSYRVWLEMFVDGEYQVVSNIVEYDVPGNYAYQLTLGSGYEVTRSGSFGDSVSWVVIKNGSVVLQRNASNELSYTYYSNTSGSTIQIYLQQFIGGYYQPVSNTVSYSVP